MTDKRADEIRQGDKILLADGKTIVTVVEAWLPAPDAIQPPPPTPAPEPDPLKPIDPAAPVPVSPAPVDPTVAVTVSDIKTWVTLAWRDAAGQLRRMVYEAGDIIRGEPD